MSENKDHVYYDPAFANFKVPEPYNEPEVRLLSRSLTCGPLGAYDLQMVYAPGSAERARLEVALQALQDSVLTDPSGPEKIPCVVNGVAVSQSRGVSTR